MNARTKTKLVDYSLSASDFEEDRQTAEELTPIPFKSKRVHRRIIRSPSPLSLSVTARAKERHRGQLATKGSRGLSSPSPHKFVQNCDGEAKRVETVKKRWTVNDCRKLKLALKIIDPTTDADWDSISSSIGGGRTAGECRAKATRQFNWKHSPLSSSSSSSSTTKTTTATKTTAAAATNVGAHQRPTSSNDRTSDPYSKFFRENVDFSLGELDLDDTLLNAAYGSPPEPVKCMRRPFMLRPIDPLEDERAANDSDDEENNGWRKGR